VGHSYKDLIAWQKARKLAAEVYRVTQHFPAKETYGLTAQLRRAAISVVSNIAEGQGRLTKGEFIHFLGQARGSLLEVETQLFVAFDLGYLSQADLDRMERETGDVLGLVNRLIASLRARAAGAGS
jgi:four helix bundle protein